MSLVFAVHPHHPKKKHKAHKIFQFIYISSKRNLESYFEIGHGNIVDYINRGLE
jgi:hypothetical protein